MKGTIAIRAAIRIAALGALFACRSGAGDARPVPELEKLGSAANDLIHASYGGDLARLASVAGELRSRRLSGNMSGLAHYHAGFAHFTLALMVGPQGLVSPEGNPELMAAHLDSAIAEIEYALVRFPDFADGLALLSHLYSMKLRRNPAMSQDLRRNSSELLTRALDLEPENPRVVLIEAMRLFWRPASAGGDRETGLTRWRHALELFTVERVDPLRPRWGHAEGWAWLPAAYLALRPPNVSAARDGVPAGLTPRTTARHMKQRLEPSRYAAGAPYTTVVLRTPTSNAGAMSTQTGGQPCALHCSQHL